MESATASVDVPQPVLDWLFKVLQHDYYDPRTTFHDVVIALATYKKLRVRTRVFTDKAGLSKLLLCLYGKVGNVDVLVWIPFEYPKAAPYAYIDLEATKGRSIIVNERLDGDGLFYLPILGRWNPRNCDVVKLVQDLEQAIAAQYPLRPAVGAGHGPPVQDMAPGQTISTLPVLPPKPYIQKKETHEMNRAIEASVAGTPSLPPKPPKVPAIADVQDKSDESLRELDSELSHLQLQNEPLPPKPHTMPPPSAASVPASHTQPDWLDADFTQCDEPTHRDSLALLQDTLNQLAKRINARYHTEWATKTKSIKEALDSFRHIYSYEADNIRHVEDAIVENSEVLQNEIDKLNGELEKAQKYEEKYPNGGVPDMNACVTAETIALNQLYMLVARDYALSDSIQILSVMLNQGLITVDPFIKKTRSLAAEQFLARFHIDKILQLLDN
ncbi:AaceriAAL006Cp [[Ashbya] aceris (nom. inval.)]|nr:AaceriAAL006Cp [[Ashbya] aceris (nom. inval.)]